MRPNQECVRWRINSGPVEWFFNGHWNPLLSTKMAVNLCDTIAAVTSTYPEQIEKVDPFETALLKLLAS